MILKKKKKDLLVRRRVVGVLRLEVLFHLLLHLLLRQRQRRIRVVKSAEKWGMESFPDAVLVSQ
jgi:hypothetical protein